MAWNFDELRNSRIDVSKALEYTGDAEKYVNALERYYANYDKIKRTLSDSLESGNMKEYSVCVHSLKSNSYMLGMTELSEKAKGLEALSREGKTEEVTLGTKALFSEYERVIGVIEPFCHMDYSPQVEKIGAKEALSVTSFLMTALEEFDDDRAMTLLKQLEGYSFDFPEHSLLIRAMEYVENFDYDSAEDLIKELIKAIK